jgi:hypothetical protein
MANGVTSLEKNKSSSERRVGRMAGRSSRATETVRKPDEWPARTGLSRLSGASLDRDAVIAKM